MIILIVDFIHAENLIRVKPQLTKLLNTQISSTNQHASAATSCDHQGSCTIQRFIIN